MNINKRIYIGITIGFITIFCVGCGKITTQQSQVTDTITQPATKESVDGTKITSTEKTTEEPANSPIDHIIILKDKIHPSLPDYTFKVYGQKMDNLYSANKIEIYNGAKNKEKLQELMFSDTSTPDGDKLGVIIEDMNFDGYKDIRIQQFLPATANVPYYYWLWDKETSKFIKNNDFEIITAPIFDSKNKLIKSNVKENATTYYDYEYKFINNKITLIKETQRISDLDKKVWHVTIKELIKNEMKVIKKYDEKIK